LANVVSNTEEVALTATSLTHQQVASIFTTVSEQSSTEILSLRGTNLEGFEISPQVLATCVRQLETLNLSKTNLSEDMVKGIFAAIAETPGNLKALNMCDNDVNSVDQHVMAKVVQQMEELNLEHTYLSTDQLVAIMATLDESIGNLKCFNISNNRYTAADEAVDANVMARAVNKLEKAFVHESVTKEQAKKILEEALQSTSLQELTLGDYDPNVDDPSLLWCVPLVDEHLLLQAKQVIPKIFEVSEFQDIYDTDEDSDNEEFDPDQYDGPPLVEIDGDGVEIENLDNL